MNDLPLNLAVPELLAQAASGSTSVPWAVLRRRVNPTRAIYTFRSDVLYYYTDTQYGLNGLPI